jgi:hypothetical protein
MTDQAERIRELEQRIAEVEKDRLASEQQCATALRDAHERNRTLKRLLQDIDDVGFLRPRNTYDVELHLRLKAAVRNDQTTSSSGGTARRVEQRTERDCLRCCLAMVTGLQYEDVPDLTPHGDNWARVCETWLGSIGAGLIIFQAPARYIPPWLPVIAQGPTERSETHHCVVVTAEAVIDPHPSQAGIATVVHTFAVVFRHTPQERP